MPKGGKRGPRRKTREFQPPNPTGICECGCKGITPIAKLTDLRYGIIAGHHVRRIPNHHANKKQPIQKRIAHIVPPNPSGICMCGECGRTTRIASHSSSERGWLKGHHIPLIHNHHGKPKIRYVLEDRGFLTPCWIWALMRDKDGYGTTSVDGFPRKAHRAYHERFKGPIPKGYDVDHLCHVTGCVNPDHLEAVPPIVNQRRKLKTKLSMEIARYIRSSTETPTQLGKRFGVFPSSIISVRNNKTWLEEKSNPAT